MVEPSRDGDVSQQPYLVVALGASAGGLEAFQTFFSRMPADPGMAFVLVQHLDPNHASFMPELLSHHTAMPVEPVHDETPVEANRVYIIPPNATLTIDGGVLRITEPRKPRGYRMPIDDFFRSLAEDQGESAVCVVMSGTGSDGTLGLKAVKEGGGFAVAQAPESAKFDSMPQSAISTGLVDLVVPVEEMPARLLEYAQHFRAIRHDKGADGIRAEAASHLAAIFSMLKRQTGHDFTDYKQSTLVRRIQRRMQVRQIDSVIDYVACLRDHDEEVEALFKDLLIGVTQFFRDPEGFEALERKVVPRLFEGVGAGGTIRVWVPGCSTGEEAFSIAILLKEAARRLDSPAGIQIFATDIDGNALEAGRHGRYPEGIAGHVSPERLERFFTRDGFDYQVNSSLRETIIFSAHNVISDPPFSRLDLISCRNLLIYLEPELQRRLIPLFHYALRDEGYLFLGPSESVAASPELYTTVDKSHHIYRAKAGMLRTLPTMPLIGRRSTLALAFPPQGERPRPPDVGRVFEKKLLDEYAPPAVVVNADGRILYTSGKTSRYLELPTGQPRLDIVDMSRESVRMVVRAAIHQAVKRKTEMVQHRLSVPTPEGQQELSVIVRPLREARRDDELYMVVFREAGLPHEGREPGTPLAEGIENDVVRQLENELRTTKEYLQSTVEEVETSNEELKSSNEELLSMNEELQSSNEELQTSQEELQSVNEELQTVNAELGTKVEELDRANSDLQNLFESTQIATVFLDHDLTIKRFTPATSAVFRLIGTDVGRRLTDISRRFEDGDLSASVRKVLTDLSVHEEEVHQLEDDRWFTMRILPYRTLVDEVDGVVITFTDITHQKVAQAEISRLNDELRRGVQELETVLEAAPVGIAITSGADASKIRVNATGARILGIASGDNASVEASPAPYRVLVDGREVPAADLPVQVAARTGAEVSGYQCQVERQDGSLVDLRMSALPLLDDQGAVRRVVGAFADVTPLRDAQRVAARRARQQELLAGFGAFVLEGTDEAELIAQLALVIQAGVEAELAEVVKREEQGTLRLVAGAGWDEGAVGTVTFAAGRGSHAGFIAEAPGVVRFDDLERESRFESSVLAGRGIRSGLGVPVGTPADLLGTIGVYSTTAEAFSDYDAAFLLSASGLLAEALTSRAAERALERSEEIHRTIGEIVPFGSWTCDAEGRCTSVTRPFLEMTGMTLEEAKGFGWIDRLHPADREPTRDAWERCVAEQGEWEWEYRIRGADGQWRAVRTSGRPIRGVDGAVEKWVGFHIDVTARREAEDALRRMNETLEQRVAERTQVAEQRAAVLRTMAAEMSRVEEQERRRMAELLHDDLQQILVAAKLRTYGLEGEAAAEKDRIAAREIGQLLEDSIEASRGLTTRLSPPVRFEEGLRGPLDWLVRWFAHEHGLSVKVHLEVADEPFSEDVGVFLFHAVKELLFNVSKYAGTDEAVVGVTADDETLRVSVEDEGRGFSQKAGEVGASRGFGLFNIGERLRLLEGSLEIDTAPGKGTRVRMSVPRASVVPAGREPQPRTGGMGGTVGEAVPRRSDGRIHVLVADDHSLMRDGLTALLRGEPDMVVVGQAADGLEAVEQARRFVPDVVLMDQSMPGMTGTEATRIITSELPGVKVIGLSMHRSDEMADSMLAAGAIAYFTKGEHQQALLDGIRAAMDGNRPDKDGRAP